MSDNSTLEKEDKEKADQVNDFVEAREALEELEEADVPAEIEKKIQEQMNRRRVECRTCGKKFTRSVLLKAHVASEHLGLARWECALCGKGVWSRQEGLGHVA